MQAISVFLDITKAGDFRWKILMSAELKRCVTWFIDYLDLLYVRYNCAKFHGCRNCVTDFRKVGFLPSTAPKRPLLNRVNVCVFLHSWTKYLEQNPVKLDRTKSLISALACFFTVVDKVWFLEGRLGTRLCLHPNLRFS